MSDFCECQRCTCCGKLIVKEAKVPRQDDAARHMMNNLRREKGKTDREAMLEQLKQYQEIEQDRAQPLWLWRPWEGPIYMAAQ